MIIWTNVLSVHVALFSLLLSLKAAAVPIISASFCLAFLPLPGGFSETYAALCDYNGISCKEEVQWVSAVGLCTVWL